jgi:DNA-binding transcriptional MerR regulator
VCLVRSKYQKPLKIGDLAKRSGLTVRALHHYDSIGLLSPSVRTEARMRLYGEADLIRLHRIQALKQVGYSLIEIRQSLDDPDINPLDIIQRQITIFRERARQATQLRERLERAAVQMSAGAPLANSDWLNVLELMSIYDRHLTEEEVGVLHNPKQPSASQIEAQWAELVTEVRHAMNARVPIDSAAAQAFAWRWVRLVIAKTNNSAALAIKLRALQASELRAQQIVGIGPDMFDWIGKAIVHARMALFAKHLASHDVALITQRQLAGASNMDDWPRLVLAMREQMQFGTPVDAEEVRALVLRWQQLFRDCYCGADDALGARVRAVIAREPDLNLGVGVDDALMNYVRTALQFKQHETTAAL